MKAKHCITSLIAVALVGGLSTFTLRAAEETQAALKAQAKITQAEAERTALAKVPGGKIKAAELEREHGKLIWSFDISLPKSKNITEVQVDAKTGKIVSTQIETPKDQANEPAADRKAEKK
jgi:type II secretory pathway pseudopilin PulG